MLLVDGDRYHLFAEVVMPHHAHVLIKQVPPKIHRLGWSSCTRPEADYKSALPGGYKRLLEFIMT